MPNSDLFDFDDDPDLSDLSDLSASPQSQPPPPSPPPPSAQRPRNTIKLSLNPAAHRHATIVEQSIAGQKRQHDTRSDDEEEEEAESPGKRHRGHHHQYTESADTEVENQGGEGERKKHKKEKKKKHKHKEHKEHKEKKEKKEKKEHKKHKKHKRKHSTNHEDDDEGQAAYAVESGTSSYHDGGERREMNDEQDEEDLNVIEEEEEREEAYNGDAATAEADIRGYYDERVEIEEDEVDDDDDEDNDAQISWAQDPLPYAHVPTGGKRPYTFIDNEIDDDDEPEEEEEEEEEEDPEVLEERGYTSTRYSPNDEDEEIEPEDEDDEDEVASERRASQSHLPPQHPPKQTKVIIRQASTATAPPSQSSGKTIVSVKPASVTTSATTGGKTTGGTGGSGKRKPGRPPKSSKGQGTRTWTPRKKDLETVLIKLLDAFVKRDAYAFFLDPVDTKLVPDYRTVITHPMDLGTMRSKVQAHAYRTMDDFSRDFHLLIANAKTYNRPDTAYYRSADKLLQYGAKAIEREGKTVVYEDPAQPTSTSRGKKKDTGHGSVKRETTVKVEEEVDILGFGDGGGEGLARTKVVQREGDEWGQVPRAGTPITTSVPPGTTATTVGSGSGGKKRREDKRRRRPGGGEMGIVYAPDGSLVGVHGVPDISHLIAQPLPYGSTPRLTILPPSHSYRDSSDMNSLEPTDRSAGALDYGAFASLGPLAPASFLSPRDAEYLYGVFGDERGEAYVKSLCEFVGGVVEGVGELMDGRMEMKSEVDEVKVEEDVMPVGVVVKREIGTEIKKEEEEKEEEKGEGSTEEEQRRSKEELARDLYGRVDRIAEQLTRGAWTVARRVVECVAAPGDTDTKDDDRDRDILVTELGVVDVRREVDRARVVPRQKEDREELSRWRADKIDLDALVEALGGAVTSEPVRLDGGDISAWLRENAEMFKEIMGDISEGRSREQVVAELHARLVAMTGRAPASEVVVRPKPQPAPPPLTVTVLGPGTTPIVNVSGGGTTVTSVSIPVGVVPIPAGVETIPVPSTSVAGTPMANAAATLAMIAQMQQQQQMFRAQQQTASNASGGASQSLVPQAPIQFIQSVPPTPQHIAPQTQPPQVTTHQRALPATTSTAQTITLRHQPHLASSPTAATNAAAHGHHGLPNIAPAPASGSGSGAGGAYGKASILPAASTSTSTSVNASIPYSNIFPATSLPSHPPRLAPSPQQASAAVPANPLDPAHPSSSQQDSQNAQDTSFESIESSMASSIVPGTLLPISASKAVSPASARKAENASRSGLKCANCHTSSTPGWRAGETPEQKLCNACGLYYAKNKAHRPPDLWKIVAEAQ